MVETDASDLAIGSVLNQLEEHNRWHPVAFFSKSFNSQQVNYDVHDKEMLAIVKAFQEWKHMLIGSYQTILVYTDHRNLEWFTMTKVFNHRQAH